MKGVGAAIPDSGPLIKNQVFLLVYFFESYYFVEARVCQVRNPYVFNFYWLILHWFYAIHR
jgi:hypothetical protein